MRTFRWLAILLATCGLSWLFADGGFKLPMIFTVVVFIVPFLIISFRDPVVVMMSAVVMGFLIAMLSRYIPGIPFGLSIDGFLFLVILILVFQKDVRWEGHYFTNPLSMSLFGWLAFTILTIANPDGASLTAWFYANRGLSLYPFLFAILAIYALQNPKNQQLFLIFWAIFAVFGSFWAMKQIFIGVSNVERQWLNAGAATTHILFGKLRAFSYFSDCAQFAANQSHTTLVFGIIGAYPGLVKRRWVYLMVALISFYGMALTGTRGVLAVLAIGGFVYLIMIKNFKIVIIGFIVGIGTFSFLKYTTIGQANYQIQRMRSALDTDDPSFQVRQQRIETLKSYLSSRPLGGGIGSAGYWGKRFSPGSFLGEIGTDGHYTRVWMETGQIGLTLYLAMLGMIALYLGARIWKIPDSLHKQTLIAYYCAYIGLCVASYTNGLMVQNPTGVLLFTSLGLIYVGTKATTS